MHNYPRTPPGLDFTAWNIGDAIWQALLNGHEQAHANLGARLSRAAQREAKRDKEREAKGEAE